MDPATGTKRNHGLRVYTRVPMSEGSESALQ